MMTLLPRLAYKSSGPDSPSWKKTPPEARDGGGDRRERKGEKGLGRGEEGKWGEDGKRKRKNEEG